MPAPVGAPMMGPCPGAARSDHDMTRNERGQSKESSLNVGRGCIRSAIHLGWGLVLTGLLALPGTLLDRQPALAAAMTFTVNSVADHELSGCDELLPGSDCTL